MTKVKDCTVLDSDSIDWSKQTVSELDFKVTIHKIHASARTVKVPENFVMPELQITPIPEPTITQDTIEYPGIFANTLFTDGNELHCDDVSDIPDKYHVVQYSYDQLPRISREASLKLQSTDIALELAKSNLREALLVHTEDNDEPVQVYLSKTAVEILLALIRSL